MWLSQRELTVYVRPRGFIAWQREVATTPRPIPDKCCRFVHVRDTLPCGPSWYEKKTCVLCAGKRIFKLVLITAILQQTESFIIYCLVKSFWNVACKKIHNIYLRPKRSLPFLQTHRCKQFWNTLVSKTHPKDTLGFSKLCMLGLLFVLGFSSLSKIFHSYGDVIIAGEGLQILTYARHSWPLSSEGSLAYHTYCDTGHPFKMVISEDPWHSNLQPSV